jgi:hypothetical protein
LPKEKTLFGDFRAILACSGFKDSYYDSNCEVYMYGRYLRKALSQLTGIHGQTDTVVYIFIVFFLLIFAHLVAALNKNVTRLVYIGVFLSPVIALLLQRANMDIVLFTLSWVSIRLYLRNLTISSLVLLLIATSIKVYPVALLLILVSLSIASNKTLRVKVFSTVIGLLGVWMAVTDIANIPWLPSDGRNSFGLRIFGEYLIYLFGGSGKQMLPLFGILLGLVFLFGLGFAMSLSYLKPMYPRITVDLEDLIWFVYFFAIFLSGISVDYRLIFFVPMLSTFEKIKIQTFNFLLIMVLLIFYLSYPFGFLQVIGDLALFVVLTYFAILLLRNRNLVRDELKKSMSK